MLNKRIISLHYLVFIASRYLLILCVANSLKNICLYNHNASQAVVKLLVLTRSKLWSQLIDLEMSQCSPEAGVQSINLLNVELFHCDHPHYLQSPGQRSSTTKCRSISSHF